MLAAGRRIRYKLTRMTGAHSHSHQHVSLSHSIATERGIRVLKVSLCVLVLAALGEGIMAWLTASVGLLADMIHNFSDALVALPLWFAFSLAKKKPSATYPYGLYRVEDFVGL